MRGQPIYVGQSFAGGLNTRDAAYEVDFTQARDLLNVTGTVSGAVRKRDGLVTFSTPPVQLNSLFAVESTPTRWLLGQGGSGFYKIDGSGTVTAITGATTPSSARWSMVQGPAIGGQGPVYLSNGVDTPQQWTGSGNVADWTATSGSLPNGKFLAFIGNRVFAAGMSSYGGVSDAGSALVWSDIGNPRSWPAQNVVLLDPNDGDQITGLGTFGPNLIVFKRRKAYVITSLDTGANRRISADTGCIAARSIVETPNGTYFLTLDKGVYITNGSSMQPVSDVIRPTLESVVESQRPNAAGAFWKDHYYLSVALVSGSANDTLLDYDTLQRSWWAHSVSSSCLAVWRPVGNAELHTASSTLARTSRCFVAGQSTDNGAAFVAYWTTGWLAPSYFRRRLINSPDMRKRLRGVRFDASGAFSLYIARDFTGGGMSFQHVADYDYTGATALFGGTGVFGGGTGVFGGPVSTAQGRASNLGVQRAFSLRFYSNSTKPWELEDYVVIMGERAD